MTSSSLLLGLIEVTDNELLLLCRSKHGS
jgi:hypothetical protein